MLYFLPKSEIRAKSPNSSLSSSASSFSILPLPPSLRRGLCLSSVSLLLIGGFSTTATTTAKPLLSLLPLCLPPHLALCLSLFASHSVSPSRSHYFKKKKEGEGNARFGPKRCTFSPRVKLWQKAIIPLSFPPVSLSLSSLSILPLPPSVRRGLCLSFISLPLIGGFSTTATTKPLLSLFCLSASFSISLFVSLSSPLIQSLPLDLTPPVSAAHGGPPDHYM